MQPVRQPAVGGARGRAYRRQPGQPPGAAAPPVATGRWPMVELCRPAAGHRRRSAAFAPNEANAFTCAPTMKPWPCVRVAPWRWVGSGWRWFLSAEVAATAQGLGCEVTLLESRATALAGRVLPPVISDALLAALHREQGVDVRLNVALECIHADATVQLVDGQRRPGGGRHWHAAQHRVGRSGGAWTSGGAFVSTRSCAPVRRISTRRGTCAVSPGGPLSAPGNLAQRRSPGPSRGVEPAGAHQLAFETIPGFWSDQYAWGLHTVGVMTALMVRRQLPEAACCCSTWTTITVCKAPAVGPWVTAQPRTQAVRALDHRPHPAQPGQPGRP